jgi:hypothetical protein
MEDVLDYSKKFLSAHPRPPEHYLYTMYHLYSISSYLKMTMLQCAQMVQSSSISGKKFSKAIEN